MFYQFFSIGRAALAALLLLIAIPNAWASRPELTIYTYGSMVSEWGAAPKLTALFEVECGCKLNWVALDDGVAILNRLRLEGAATKADLVLGLDDALITEAKATQLFAPHQQDLKQLAIEGGWSDGDFLPYDYGWFAWVYDQERLKNPPKSMQELLDREEISLVYSDPRSATPGQGLLLWLEKLYGANSTAAWQKIAKRTVTVTKGWSESYALFLSGEADMVLSYTSSPAYHQLAEGKSNYRAAAFAEGHYRQVEVAARLAGSKQPQLAQQFLHFLISPRAQAVLPETNWIYPVVNIPLPKGFAEAAPKPTQTLSLPASEIATKRKEWLEQWLTAVSE